MQVSKLALVAALALNGAGCASLSGYPEDPQPPSVLVHLKEKYFSDALTACYNKGDCTAELGISGKQAIRDHIVRNKLVIYDSQFAQFERDLNAGRNAISLGSDLASLALTGLAATTGNAPTKAALAAASGGLLAANGDFDKDIFYQKTLFAITTQMEANRTNVEATILAGLRKPDAEYSLDSADADLVKLGTAGNINDAIASLTKQAIEAKADADAWVQAYRSMPMADTDTSKTLRDWLTLDPAGNIAKLKAWWSKPDNTDTKKFSGNIPLEALVNAPTDEMEALRKKAITALDIK